MSRAETSPGYFRLTLLWASISLCAMFILLLGQRWYAETAEQSEELREQAQLIGTNASAALAFDDSATGKEILATLNNNIYMKAAALYRSDGTLLAEFHRPNTRALPVILANLQGQTGTHLLNLYEMQLAIPIALGNRDVGMVVLLSTMDRVYGELAEFFWFFVAIALAAIVLAYFAGQRMRRRIRDSHDELENSQAMIRQLSTHREKLVEDEHKRIAIEIHDDLGQILTTAMLHLKSLDKALQINAPALMGQAQEIQVLVNDAFHSVKNIALDLRPAVLNFGFVAALEWLVERTLGNSGIKFQIDISNPVPALDERSSITLFRIAQESLTNIVRHAQARNAWISVKTGNDHFSLTIEDDGIGFRNGGIQDKPGFGLLGIRERAESLRGHAEITSIPEKGVCVAVTLPLSIVIEGQPYI